VHESGVLDCTGADSDCGGWIYFDFARNGNGPAVFQIDSDRGDFWNWILVDSEEEPSQEGLMFGDG
jgi:hypothetical protein